MATSLTRRGFVVGAAALAAGAACSKKKDPTDVVVKPEGTSTTKVSGNARTLSAVMAGSMFQTGINERVSFALFEGVPASLLPDGNKVLVAFASEAEKKFSTPVEAVRHDDGIEERPYYVVNHTFSTPGRYGMRAAVPNHDASDAFIEVSDPANVAWPTPGKPLPKVKTPTTADAMGVDPICTRAPKPCGWHGQSLDAVLGNGKPTVVMLSTPALCKSAVCGPVLDILLGEEAALGGAANLVHVEVYADRSGEKLSPAFAAFKTDTEPVVYFADGAGIVTDRIVGPFDRVEARAALTKLTS